VSLGRLARRSAPVACVHKLRVAGWLSLPMLLAFLAFGHGALAASGLHRSKARKRSAPRAAYLDTTFGRSGRVTLRMQFPWGPIPVLMRDDGLVVSNGEVLMRLTPDGELDEFFGTGGTLRPPASPGGSFEIQGLAVDSQDRLVVAGTSQLPKEDAPSPVVLGGPTPEGPQAARVMRYLPSGTLDPSFGDGGITETDLDLPAPRGEAGEQLLARPWVEVAGVAVDSQDRVLLTGGAAAGIQFGCAHDWFFNTLTYAAFVARLTEAGALDSSFSGDGVFGGHSVTENPLRAEGSADPGIGPGDEMLYASGYDHCPRKRGSLGLAKLRADGEPASSFGVGGAIRRWLGATAIEPRGAITTVGYLSTWYNTKEPARIRVTRLRPNGRPDRSFGRRGQTVFSTPGGAESVLGTIATDARGRVLLGGTTVSARKLPGPTVQAKKRRRPAFLLLRLGAQGRLDRAFAPRGRVVTRFGWLEVRQSNLLLDSHGRAVMVGAYGPWKNQGLAVARYVIDR
jgi:uncharacterized delta-60 repeat protein